MGRFVRVHVVELFCVANHKAGKTERLHIRIQQMRLRGKGTNLETGKFAVFLEEKLVYHVWSCLMLFKY